MIPVAALFMAVNLLAQAPGVSGIQTPNAFSGVETHFLANGLKVWFKQLPGDPVVSISIALPFGSDQDPPGKEQLAHFTEHMLFSDQPGLSEEEIRRQIEERGGVYNASVTADRTFYFVRIGKEHALFALDWLFRIIAPHAMTSEIIETQREPVALEVGARPRQFFDWVWSTYLNPPILRMPGFWESEFGLETWNRRDYYPYRSLYAIDSDDLRSFYDTYYVPALMTLTLAGDLRREEIFDKIDETFALLSPNDALPSDEPLVDPDRYRESFFWDYRSNVYFSDRFKFYAPTADDDVMLIFLSRFLGKRLNDELRFGERKATYGISVGVVKRGGATYLSISGGIKPSEFAYARDVLERELDALRSGRLPREQFEADRAAVVRQLLVTNTTSEDLERWVSRYFYDPRVYSNFPDLATTFQNYKKSEVEAFVSSHFVPERQVLLVIYRNPLTQGLLALLVVGVVWSTLFAVSRWLLQRVDMTRIRYVARFHGPRPYYMLAMLSYFALVALTARLLVYGFEIAATRWLIPVDSFVLQWLVYAFMLAAVVSLLILSLAAIPRKLLVFDDHVRIKYLSFRSLAIPPDDIAEISLRRFREVWLSKRLWKCVPLALGLFAPAVYLRRRSGGAYFFDVRDRNELLSVLRENFMPQSPGETVE